MKKTRILHITWIVAGLFILAGCASPAPTSVQEPNEKSLQFVEFYSPT